MGKPATTYFCGNGHILEDNPEHIFGEYDRDYGVFGDSSSSKECPYCKNKQINMVVDWYDSDLPLHVPIGELEVLKEDHKGNKYYIKIPVFDVSCFGSSGDENDS